MIAIYIIRQIHLHSQQWNIQTTYIHPSQSTKIKCTFVIANPVYTFGTKKTITNVDNYKYYFCDTTFLIIGLLSNSLLPCKYKSILYILFSILLPSHPLYTTTRLFSYSFMYTCLFIHPSPWPFAPHSVPSNESLGSFVRFHRASIGNIRKNWVHDNLLLVYDVDVLIFKSRKPMSTIVFNEWRYNINSDIHMQVFIFSHYFDWLHVFLETYTRKAPLVQVCRDQW